MSEKPRKLAVPAGQEIEQTFDSVASAHPLVTLAIFAYNQEDIIHEAIEGALAQTYPQLEIILSDDCSSDRTYEIMKGVSDEYTGPHKIRLNRNSINLGTAAHVSTVFALSQGRLFVVAAGDDISEKERVSKIVSAWQDNGQGAALIHSAMAQFDAISGKNLNILRRKTGVSSQLQSLSTFLTAWQLPAYAPTCAYSREIFEWFPPLSGGSLIEDLPLMVRSLAMGNVIYIDEPLVRARKSEMSAGQGFSVLQPHRWNRFIHSRMTALYDVSRDVESISESLDPATLHALKRKARRKVISHSKVMMELPLASAPSVIFRLRMTVRLIVGGTISGDIKSRTKFALIFAFPELHLLYKARKEARRVSP